MDRRAPPPKLDKLAALKAARAGKRTGKSRLAEWKPAEDTDLYDEVSEEQYRQIVGGRLQRDDFIEDDDGSGYQDNGMDVWEGGEAGASDEEEEERPRARKVAKPTKKTRQPVHRPAPPSAYRPAISAGKEDDFMASLLSSVASAPSPAPSASRPRPFLGALRKRKSSPDYASPSSEGYDLPSSDALPTSSDGPEPPSEEAEGAGMWGYRSKKPRTSGASSVTVKAEPRESPPPTNASARRGVSFAEDDKENVDVDGASDDEDEFAVRSGPADRAAPAPKSKLFALGGNRVKAEPVDPATTKSRRTMVNSSSVSAKAQAAAAAAAAAQKAAEEHAREVKAESGAQVNGQSKPAGKTTKSWQTIQEGLNVGTGAAETDATAAEDEDDMYNASVKLRAAKKGRVVPGPNPADAIDAFEPEEVESGKMQLEGDDQERTLRMYWLDYYEADKGVVHLIGKVRDRATGRFVSACVSIEGIQRNLFVLPRPTRVENGHDTEMDVSPAEIYKELDDFRRLHEVEGRLLMKSVKRKYAFEVQDVPQGEHEWYKVIYGFDQPRLPMSSSGATFSKIFGTNTSAFEMLVIKRKIKGPCWLEIKGCTRVNSKKPTSWCKLEVRTGDPKNVSPFAETDATAPKETPPLTVMSLSARTIVNHMQNTQEILAVTASVWENYNIDDTTPIEKLRHASHTVVRPLGASFPPKFEVASRRERQPIQSVANEKILLNSVLGIISRNDPDLIIGHDFLEGTLETFLQRVKALKADHWSRIGRIRRTALKIGGKGYQNMKYLTGRLLADLDTDGSRSMIDSVSWSMTEMCKTHLGFEREDIDPDTTTDYFDAFGSTPDKLLHFLRHLQMDAFFQMAIAAKVQLLPLTQQLTTLAGNSWNRTLTGARAERNEYILLHEFHRLKYICPDKGEGKASSRQPKTQKFDNDGTLIPQVKRLKYQGGLVFEPKRGLWDTYVMVMDFNSLYPSIIQEYNIDFTTVERHDDEDAVEEVMPDVPGKEVPQGVLPRLIATLVARRREVKGNMKAKNATPGQLQQWDIRQKALKLTANSMYGCLGFDGSRFYARPLAALTTFKGREILTATKELAEGLSLDVVYGDTDSVFVNSNVTDYAEAIKIANEFKKTVNERYRLLEIDLDAVFSRVLLLQKKKYAAMKISEDGTAKLEIKGLDMVRREFCKLSKNASEFVLGKIMSGAATEQVVSDVHDYLTTLGEDLRGGKVDLEDLIINKRLGKNPEDYPDKKGQPHVQVALRLKAKGQSGKTGDVIPYVFCLGADGKTSRSAQADRAFHPDEYRKAESGLKIDNDFYLSNQVLTVVERLCEDIEGTDRSRLAECLGLDPTKFQNASVAGVVEKDFVTFASQLSDKDRFREASPLTVRCRACKAETLFLPLLEDQGQLQLIRNEGVICPCGSRIAPASISVQVELAIRANISRYYLGLLACSECREKTRSIGVYGGRCVSTPHCRGEMKPDYPDSKLENQLLYFASLFDVDKAVEAVAGTARAEEINALAMHNRPAFEEIKAMVTSYLNKDGRRWVNMGELFSFVTEKSRRSTLFL